MSDYHIIIFKLCYSYQAKWNQHCRQGLAHPGVTTVLGLTHSRCKTWGKTPVLHPPKGNTCLYALPCPSHSPVWSASAVVKLPSESSIQGSGMFMSGDHAKGRWRCLQKASQVLEIPFIVHNYPTGCEAHFSIPTNKQGPTNFSRIQGTPQNSSRQNGDMKPDPYRGPTRISRHRTTFSRPDAPDLWTPGIRYPFWKS